MEKLEEVEAKLFIYLFPFFFSDHIGMHSQLCVQYWTLVVWSLHLHKQSNLIMTCAIGLLFLLNQ